MSSIEAGMDDEREHAGRQEERRGLLRREVLVKGAVGAGLAWTAPAVLSTTAGAQGSPLAAPEFRALVSGVFTTSGSLDTPAATVLDDRLLLVIAFGAGEDLSSTSAGLTPLHVNEAAAGEHEVHVYEKAAAGGTETVSFTCTGAVTIAAALAIYRPGTGGSVVNVEDSDFAINGGTTHEYPALVAGGSQRRVVRLGGAGWALTTGDWLSAPASNVRLLTSQSGPHAATVQVSDDVDDFGAADGTTSTSGLAITHTVSLVTA